MKKLILCAVLFLLPTFPLLGEDSLGEDSLGEDGQNLEAVHGTIQKVGNFGYGIVPDADPGTRYAPTEPLAEEFQEDGLRVVFSGTVGSADEHAGRGRRWGTPLEVTSIELLVESGDASDDP